MYVDDISMIFGITRLNSGALDDIKKVQKELDGLSRWSEENGLILNAKKTTGLVRYRGDFKMTCDIESFLPAVDFQSCVRLLGVILDDNLK